MKLPGPISRVTARTRMRWDARQAVLALTLTAGLVFALPASAAASFSMKWGSFGAGPGQFNNPLSVAVAGDGSVYVADHSNQRIQKFDSSGAFLTKWGTYGSGDGQFQNPTGVAVAGDGSVYVVDHYNHRIQKFDSSGAFLTKWGSFGSGDGQFRYPASVAVAADGSIYVTDLQNHRIQKFDSSGAYLAQWGSVGAGDGQFYSVFGVGVGGDGSVYVIDFDQHRLQKFDSNGAFLTSWGSSGSGDGRFLNPVGVAVGGDGSVYVVDYGNHRIQRFDSSGALLTKWGSYGSADGQFNHPRGLAIAGNGSVYVVDQLNHRIQRFTDGDGTAPVITPSLTGTLGENGWYVSDVGLEWTVEDPESPSSVVETGCVDATITADQLETAYACSASSLGGSAGPVNVAIKRDATSPTVTCGSASTLILNGSGTVSASVADATSGPVESLLTAAADTSSVGSKSAVLTGEDNAGNHAGASCPYLVTYQFDGFAKPVDNDGVYNVAKAGQTIPLKWRLTDATGAPATDLASAAVTVQGLTCELGTTTDQIEEYAPGSSGLQNLGDGYYAYNWKTPTSYAKSCKTLRMDLGEGVYRTALFKFTR